MPNDPMDERFGGATMAELAMQGGLTESQKAELRAKTAATANANQQGAGGGTLNSAVFDLMKQIEEKARQNADAHMAKGKKGFWGTLEKAGRLGEEAVRLYTSGGPLGYEGPMTRERNKLNKQVKELAPILQRDSAATASADARVASSENTAEARKYAADRAFQSKMSEIQSKAGITDAQKQVALANAAKIKQYVDSGLIPLEAGLKQVELDYEKNFGQKMGTTPGSVLENQAAQNDPDYIKTKTQLSLAGGAPELFRAGQGTQNTSTGQHWMTTPDPNNPNAQITRALPTSTVSGRVGNPGANQMLQMLLGGQQPQGPVNTSLAPGTGPQQGGAPQGQPQGMALPPQGQPGQPQGQQPQQAPPQALQPSRPPIQQPVVRSGAGAPSPTNPLTAKPGAPAAKKSVWIPEDEFSKPQADGTMKSLDKKAVAENSARRNAGNAITSALANVANAGPQLTKEITDIAAIEELPIVGKGLAAARRRAGTLGATEALMRESLANVKKEDILTFTGKQSAEREYGLMNETTPNTTDSVETLAAKLLKRDMLFKFWRMENEGGGGQGTWGVKKEYRNKLEDTFYQMVDKQASKLAKSFMKTGKMELDRADPMYLLKYTIDKMEQ